MKNKFLKISKVNETIRIYNTFGKFLVIIDPFEISFQTTVTTDELSTITNVAVNFDIWYSNLNECENV